MDHNPVEIERYIPPAAHPLHPYVQSIFFARGSYARELVLPKCNVDILFNLGDPIEVEGAACHAWAGTWRKSLVAGLQTGAVVSRPRGAVAIFGISLRAATCRALLPLPLSEIAGLAVDGALLLPEVDRLWERVGAEPCFEWRCRHVLGWLAARVTPPPQAGLIHCACGLLDGSPEAHRLDAVVQTTAVSSRHLRRLFRQHVGVGPAQYLRLSRFVKALRLMDSSRTLTEIAHEAFYYDQAHFCRDFREIAGMPPGQYRRAAGPALGHVFYP